MRTVHLSASAIKEFLHCPNCYSIKYVHGVRPAVDNEGQAIGNVWHKMHEIYRNTLVAAETQSTPSFNVANAAEAAFENVVGYVNKTYSTIPDTKTAEEWELERTILIVSFMAYLWYYQNDTIETLATEIGFKVPLWNPRTEQWEPIEDVVRVGRIDRIIRVNGRVSISDYKSTSSSIDPQSEYWNSLALDAQLSMYVGVAREMQAAGELEQYGIKPDDLFGGAYYDVWHKPKIGPSMLSQKDSKALLESQKYMDQDYKVEVQHNDEGVVTGVLIDGQQAVFNPGAKAGTFAVQETVQMFGARLYNDIKARPEFYFQRREIPRSDQSLYKFGRQLHNLYMNIKFMTENDTWYQNDQQDSFVKHGDVGKLCYDSTLDLSDGHTPDGFKRIFREKPSDNATETTADEAEGHAACSCDGSNPEASGCSCGCHTPAKDVQG